jgi:hypothetical protein
MALHLLLPKIIFVLQWIQLLTDTAGLALPFPNSCAFSAQLRLSVLNVRLNRLA